MTMQDTLLELNAARLAGETLSLIVAIDKEIKNKVNENANIKEEFYTVFEKSDDKATETKLEIKGKKPYKFKTKSNIKSIRVVGNLDILKKKKALSLNLKPDKQDIEQLVTILQTMGSDIDIVLDVVNDNLVRVRLYKHNPKFDTGNIEEKNDNQEKEQENEKQKEQKTKKKTKKEEYEILDEDIDNIISNETIENNIFDLIDQIRQEYAFNIAFYESDILVEEINLMVDIKLDSNQKIDELLEKYKDKPDEIAIALVIYEYLKNAGIKINYDLEKVVTKETALFIDPDLFNIVYNENIAYDKLKFEKFLHTLPQKIKSALDTLKQAVVKGAKAVAKYLKKHHLDLIIVMLLIGQLLLLEYIATIGYASLISSLGLLMLAFIFL